MSTLHPLVTKFVAAANFFDWVNSTSSTIKITLITVGGVAVIGVFLFMIFKGGFTISKVIGALIVCGLCLWGMTSGIIWAADIATATVK